MSFVELISAAHADLWGSEDSAYGSLALFAPELILCGTIVLLLLARLLPPLAWIDGGLRRSLGAPLPLVLTIFGASAAFLLAQGWPAADDFPARQELFTGMLVYDGVTVLGRSLLFAVVILVAVLTWSTGMPAAEDSGDFFTLLLGATLGMCLMLSANHLFAVFLAIEMASVPSYALAGLLRGRSLGSEAALKYAVYGAASAGVMLYGISLLAGTLEAVHLPTAASRLAERWPELGEDQVAGLVLATSMIAVGLAFKLSAVPFHFWCPDVFEGATAEVAGFLSVASKAAAVLLLVRLGVLFAAVPLPEVPPNAFMPTPADAIGPLIGALAVVTCTFGNLAAYGQHSLKRLMAYSTIAHAGYLMMGAPAAVELAREDAAGAGAAIAAIGIYLTIYLFMNLGVFAVAAYLRRASGGSDEINSLAGLLQRSPAVAIGLTLLMMSLAGIPPLAGFIGKFAIFAALVDAWNGTGKSYLLGVLIFGGLNTVLSLFYYLRVVRAALLESAQPGADRPEPAAAWPWSAAWYVGAAAGMMLVLFVAWGPLAAAWNVAAGTLGK